GRDVGLQGLAGRVVEARVLVPLVLAQSLLDVGRGLVDGDAHRARRGVGGLAGMDGTGGETKLPRIAFHESPFLSFLICGTIVAEAFAVNHSCHAGPWFRGVRPAVVRSPAMRTEAAAPESLSPLRWTER